MAMFAPIPLPGDTDKFKDVMDYFEQIQKRKAAQIENANDLTEKQREFGISKDLEQQKLAELSNYHKARIEAMLNIGTKKLTAQEQNQAMKLLDAGRGLKSITDKANKLNTLFDQDPNVTGWVPGIKSFFNKPGPHTAEVIQTAGELQAGLGRLASQRGGAQVLKWAGKMKPSEWKDVASNKGMTKSMMEDARSDYDEAKSEYEDLTGKPYPIQIGGSSSNPSGTTIMYKNGGEYHIPNDQVEAASKKGYTNAK